MNIPGPAGNLEADFEPSPQSRADTRTIAVLSHPHPQYGGSMHDAVLASCAQVLLAHGVDCLKFNFRGVGGSDGRFDHGAGEVEDLLSIVAWARQQTPQPHIWLLGYSFGAAMTWKALQHMSPERTILIAPPTAMMPFEALPELPSGIAAIAGEADDFVDHNEFGTAFSGQGRTGQQASAQTLVVAGADHFFSGAHPALQEALTAVLTTHSYIQ